MRSRSRRLIPELAGTIGIGSVAAAIALAGGAGTQWALGLWCVVAARSLAAIPNVRTQLRRTGADRPGARADRSARCWHSDLAQALGLGGVLTGWLAGAVPLAAVLAIAAMAAANTTAVRMRPRPAAVIGIQQALTGIAVVAVVAVAAPPT
jgi:hypothetical protein